MPTPVLLQLQRLPAGQAEGERERLGGGQVAAGLQEVLGGRGVALAGTGGLLDPPPERLDLDPALPQDHAGQALLVAQQGQQQVLGPDPVVPEPSGLPPGVAHRPLGALGDPHRRHLPVDVATA